MRLGDPNKPAPDDGRPITVGAVDLDDLRYEGNTMPSMPAGYTLIEPIGKGGWGTVYRGIQHSTGREVAVKILRDEVAHHAHVVERFRREAQAVSTLQHPNIVTLHDFGYTAGNRAFMVMELIRGEPLDSIIRSHGALPMSVALGVARQIALALAEAHERSIIHRDIKPQNVMLMQPGHSDYFVKVLDFGVAKWMGETRGLTAEGKVFGTPEYISPEAARNLPVDGRSDLYSLGIMMYEMLTGVLPFRGDSAVALALTHVQDPPPPFPEALGIPEDIARLVYQLLEKEPRHRPNSARIVADRLAQLEGGNGQSSDTREMSAGGSKSRGRLLPVALGALLVLSLAAGAVEWFVFGFSHLKPAKVEATGGEEIRQAPRAEVVVPPRKVGPRRRPPEGPVRLYLEPGYSPPTPGANSHQDGR